MKLLGSAQSLTFVTLDKRRAMAFRLVAHVLFCVKPSQSRFNLSSQSRCIYEQLRQKVLNSISYYLKILTLLLTEVP